jgi:hypothetical protein
MNTASASPWPVGQNDSINAVAGQSVPISVLRNDVGESLTIKSVNESSVGWGRITISEDKQSVVYTPRYGFEGEDEFWYVLEDNDGRTNAAKVIVSVNNLAWPIANIDSANAHYNEVISVPVLDNDYSVAGRISIVSANEWSVDQGKVWIGDDNEIKYQQVGEPRGDQTDEFWYVMEDELGRKNAAKVTVYLTEDTAALTISGKDDVAEASNGLRAIIPVLANDTGNELTLKVADAQTQQGGDAAIIGSVIRYTPPLGYSGTDSFSYTIEDNQGRTSSANVIVKVTKNTELSVVEYCGSTYETDGTLAGTALTDRTPVATESKYLALGNEDFIEQQLSFNGKRYYREGSLQAGMTLWFEVDGNTVKFEQAAVDEYMYIVGAYNEQLYYVKGQRLYAYDGELTKDLTDQLGSVVRFSEGSSYNVTGEARGDALYLTTRSSEGLFPQAVKLTYWRISDGLGLNLFATGDIISRYEDLFIPSRIQMDNSELTYFNGFDYRFSHQHNDSEEFWSQFYWVQRTDGDVLMENEFGAAGEMIEDNNRLFIKTAAYTTDRLGLINEPSRLLVIDNQSGGFIELATCED